MPLKLLWLTIACTLTLVLNAQESRFMMQIESSLGRSDRFFINNGALPESIVGIWERIEQPKLSYDLGILVGYTLSDRVSIHAGMKYVDWGYQSDKSELIFAVDEPTLPQFMSSKSQNRYIEIPLRLSYHLPLKSNRLKIWGGWYPSYNLSNHTVSKFYYADRVEETRSKDEPVGVSYRKFNMIADLGVGFEKILSEKISFTIGPNFRTQTFGVVDDASLNRVLFFYGLSSAIVFR